MPADLEEADRQLDQAVIEVAQRIGRGSPDVLQCLVALPELAGVELFDAPVQLGRGL